MLSNRATPGATTTSDFLQGVEEGTPVPPTPSRQKNSNFDKSEKLRSSKSGISPNRETDFDNDAPFSLPSDRPNESSVSASANNSPDVSDYVKFLLQGTGAESNVDFTSLRKELEGEKTRGEGDLSIDEVLKESLRESRARLARVEDGDGSFADFAGSIPRSRAASVNSVRSHHSQPQNNQRSSAAAALESELALWRSQKSKWAADIARRRASLDEVHRLVNEETFGGGMTVVLEGLAGLRFDQKRTEEGLPPLPKGNSSAGLGTPRQPLRQPVKTPAPTTPAAPAVTITSDSPTPLPVLASLAPSLGQYGLELPVLSLAPRQAGPLATLLNSLLDMLASSESNTANLQTAVVELENDLEVTRRALETEERGRREMESEVDEARRMMEVAEGVVEGLRVEREEAEGAVEQARADAEKLKQDNARLRNLCGQFRDRCTALDSAAQERGRMLESMERERRELVARIEGTGAGERGDGERWRDEVERERRARVQVEAELNVVKRELDGERRKVENLQGDLQDAKSEIQTERERARDELERERQRMERQKKQPVTPRTAIKESGLARDVAGMHEELAGLREELEYERERAREEVERAEQRARAEIERERERAKSEVERARNDIGQRAAAEIERERERAKAEVERARGEMEKDKARNKVAPVTPRTAIKESGLARDVAGMHEELAGLREELDYERERAREEVERAEQRAMGEVQRERERAKTEIERIKSESDRAMMGAKKEVERERERAREEVERERARNRVAPVTPRTALKESGLARDMHDLLEEVGGLREELEREREHARSEIERARGDIEQRARMEVERERERSKAEIQRVHHELERERTRKDGDRVPPMTPRTVIKESGLAKDVHGLLEEVGGLREELEARRRAEAVRREGEEGGEEIELLKSLLDKTARELDAQREQTEVLKLQVLASKRAEWVVRTDKRATAARPRTRDLIRRDKEAYRLKLFKIEGMEAEELQEMVKDICVKLDLDDALKILPALDELEAALRLLPQIRNFVSSVDSLVWNSKGAPSRKLDDTLRALEGWAAAVQEVGGLRRFRGEVHGLAGVPESGRSEGACLESLKGIKGVAERKNRDKIENTDAVHAKLVRHFRNLFDVASVDAVIPRINQLYVFEAEVESGLRRLRSMLRLQSKKPSEILAETIRFAAQRIGGDGY